MSDQVQISVMDAKEMLSLYTNDFNEKAIFEMLNKVAASYYRQGYNRAAQLERIRFDNCLKSLEAVNLVNEN